MLHLFEINRKLSIMTPKEHLLAFLKLKENGAYYRFIISGDTQTANAFIQRMRVNLSRKRTEVKEHGFAPRPFSMRVAAIIPDKENKTVEIVLRKIFSDQTIVSDINAALLPLTNGKLIKQ